MKTRKKCWSDFCWEHIFNTLYFAVILNNVEAEIIYLNERENAKVLQAVIQIRFGGSFQQALCI